MRIRVLGQYVHLPFAVLTAVEGLLFFGAFVLASMVYASTIDFQSLAHRVIELWPSALLFSLAMVFSLLSFGLYSTRQRARAFGLVVRIGIAIGVAVAAVTCLFYLLSDLWSGRGVVFIATAGGLAGLAVSRLVFSKVVDESVFKRRVLVYGCG